MSVALVRFLGDEPAGLDQNLSRVDRTFPVSRARRSVDQNIRCADGGLAPLLKKIEQLLRGIILLFGLFLDWRWPIPVKSFK